MIVERIGNSEITLYQRIMHRFLGLWCFLNFARGKEKFWVSLSKPSLGQLFFSPIVTKLMNLGIGSNYIKAFYRRALELIKQPLW